MKRASDVATVVLGFGALLVSGMVVHREWAGERGSNTAVREVGEWEAVAATGTVLGDPDAPVRIVEFSDFQCPFCARVQSRLSDLRQRHPGKIAIVYRHFPLPAIHSHAVTAGIAAECAGEQGRFEPYHDALFQGQEVLGVRPWNDFAAEAGVADLERFDQCVAEERYRERLARDTRAGEEIGVDATPAFLVGNRLIVGTTAAELLDEWVAEAIREADDAR